MYLCLSYILELYIGLIVQFTFRESDFVLGFFLSCEKGDDKEVCENTGS